MKNFSKRIKLMRKTTISRPVLVDSNSKNQISSAWLGRVRGHVSFFFKHNLVGKNDFFLAVSLSTLVVATETLGLAMTYPILTFIETRGDILGFTQSSKINETIVVLFNFLNIDVSLIPLMIVALCMITLRQFINYFSVIHHERIKWKIGKRLGRQIISVFLNGSAKFANSLKSGELTALVDYESQGTASILQIYLSTWQISVSFALYFSLIISIAPIPSVFLIIFLGVVTYFLRRIIKNTYSLGESSVRARSDAYNFVTERHSAWKTIKLYNTSKLETDKFNTIASKLVSIRIDIARLTEKMSVIFVPVAVGSLFLILFVLVNIWDVRVGTLMMFGLVMLRLIPVAQSYQKKIAQLAKFEPSMQKIGSILNNLVQHGEQTEGSKKVKALKNSIVFSDVSYSYEGSDNFVLKNVSFEIPRGKLTGIIGPSGAGKTTIIDIICGLYKPTNGIVKFDDLTLQYADLETLRRQISFLGQEPFLFDDTIKNNVLYAFPDATEAELFAALKSAGLWDFVESLPLGINTPVGDKGSRFSVGQKQRLAIARALVAKSSVVILDEPTSSLDHQAENTVIRALNALVDEGKTVIVIAHRLRTLTNAHHIIQIEGGEIVQSGKPEIVLSILKDR